MASAVASSDNARSKPFFVPKERKKQAEKISIEDMNALELETLLQKKVAMYQNRSLRGKNPVSKL